MKIKDIVKQTIDIHVHIGPEIIPRKYTVEKLVRDESGKLGGAVLKNHFYPTSPLIAGKENRKMKLFGGIVLNNAVGGLNPEAIYATSIVSSNPIMVWFPTINSEQFLKNSTYEIAPEWVQKDDFTARKANTVQPVYISDKTSLRDDVILILKMINKCKAVLATGHISWGESVLVVNQAIKMGIKKIAITHPIYQRINMPISVQKKLANKGCFIEQSYSMYTIDKIPIEKIVNQIREVGIQSVILSSDVGQTFSPPPSVALNAFAKLLNKQGFNERELFVMMVQNPRKLLGIDK